MDVVVLLAGVVDPKWRIESLAPRTGTERVEEAGLPRRLSPFDEAALETALKLRDADAAVRITAVLFGDAQSDALLRHVAAFRPQRCLRYGDDAMALWDAAQAARLLRHAVACASDTPALVLLGREFGDSDDGVLPAALAQLTGWAFCAQAHAVALQGGAIQASRMQAEQEASWQLPRPAIVSVTNHRGNRLRFPLMKNVMLAKREPVEVVAPLAATAPAVRLQRIAAAAPPARGNGACRLLQGPIEAQVAALAEWLA